MLVDSGPDGEWAESVISGGSLIAPHLLLVEVASVLRRAVLAGDLSADAATLAHADLGDLPIDLLPYEPFADRIWALRDNLTPYDAWYVAVAEDLDVALATLDRRLAAAPGPRCQFAAPETR